MLVYTTLFTLVGKDPAENHYIDMLFIWLTFLRKFAELRETDKILILADEATIDFLNSNETFAQVSKGILTPIEFRLIPQPKTLMEGMMQRYNTTHEFISNCSLHLDLDVLVCNSLNEIRKLPQNIFLACPEGELLSTDYGGHTLPYSINLKWETGYTAGIFAFTEGEQTTRILKAIYEDCATHTGDLFYTVDQPYFNKHIYPLESKYTIPEDWLENNEPFDERKDSAVFLNYCGEPGKGKLHFQKLLTQLCILCSS